MQVEENMPVKNTNMVKVEYEGKFDDGTIFDSSAQHDGKPLQFQVGAHQVIEGFEKAVLGKELGEEIKIRLEPSEAYGDYDPKKIQKVPKDQFPPEQTPEIGMMLQMQNQHGDHVHTIIAVIKEVGEKEITLDLNHPMAGKVLNFKMKIVDISECQPGCDPGSCSSCGQDH